MKAVLDDGTRVWANSEGEQHRDAAPAVIYNDGSEEWWSHGQLHREDDPAGTVPSLGEYWYQHNELYKRNVPGLLLNV